MARGFGIAAVDDERVVKEIARHIQALGYQSMWTNDTPAADGLRVARWIQEESAELEVGVGVVPCDRRPVPSVTEALKGLGLDSSRFILGLGAGFSERPLGLVMESVTKIRQEIPDLRVGVAAMGPSMCRLAGELADLVLFNFMTPERITWASKKVAEGESKRATGKTVRAAYVRAALGRDSTTVLNSEAERYATMPHYSRHFDSMDSAVVGIAISDEDEPTSAAKSNVTAYEQVLDLTVIRGLTPDATPKSIVAIAQAFSPA